MASDLMDDAFGMSGYNPDAMDKVIQADGGQAECRMPSGGTAKNG